MVLCNSNLMVFILDGCSYYYAYIWSKSGISICVRHLVTYKESSNPIFFRERPHQHTCTTYSVLLNYLSTMANLNQFSICNISLPEPGANTEHRDQEHLRSCQQETWSYGSSPLYTICPRSLDPLHIVFNLIYKMS